MAAHLADEPIAAIRRMVDLGFSNPSDVRRRLAGVGIVVGRKSCSDHIKDYQYSKRAEWPIDRPTANVEPDPSTPASPEVELKPDPATKRTYKESGDSAELTYPTNHEVRTLDDAIKYAGVDLSVWAVKGWECTSWEMVAKSEEIVGHNGKDWKIRTPQKHHLWRVHLKLERVKPDGRAISLADIFAPYRALAPQFARKPNPPRDSDVMLVVGLMDVHFGKLAWAAECGEDYDLAIAERVFADAIDELMNKTAHLKISKIYLPVGNDLAHIDGPDNATAGGTVVDTDGRHRKVKTVVKRALKMGVERIMDRAPVDLFAVPGNHDKTTTMDMMDILEAHFHKTDRVSVDMCPKDRKYRTLGRTELGFTHGEHVGSGDAGIGRLINLMADERRAQLAITWASEWICGHRHRPQQWVTKVTDSYRTTTVRFLRALSATDAWHYEGMMTGVRRAAEAYYYHEGDGYQGHVVANVAMAEAC